MKCVFSILFLFLVAIGNAQIKRTQNWFFGDSAGLSFATDPPSVLNNGAMNALEGCATISDTSGNLLFYTNGSTVWNKNHGVMENGTGLYGHPSSTQAALIIPLPENDTLFYIFTTDAVGQRKGLSYSIVNLSANGGLGRIEDKNINLRTPVCEKLTATYHENNRDIWVSVHDWGNNSFVSYLITKKGILDCPIISNSGSTFSGNVPNAQGEMKFSPSGNLLASTVFNPFASKVELFEFNRLNGQISFWKSFDNFILPSSVEFSPNEQFIYVSHNKNSLSQFDLLSSSISGSKFTFLNTGSSSWTVTALQLAPDGKIYLSFPDSAFLGAISYPDSNGTSAGFEINSINLNGATCQYGLPNFVTSYFRDDAITLHYESSCTKDSFRFYCTTKSNIHSWKWVLFDEQQTRIDSSNNSEAHFSIIDSGFYKIVLIADSDTLEKTFYKEPVLELGENTLLCNASQLMLSIPNNFRCIEWQDGSGSSQYTATNSGKYAVSAVNLQGCRLSDTIAVQFVQLPSPGITQSHDTLYTDTGYTYQWFFNGNPTAGTEHYLPIAQNGEYQVEIIDINGCSSLSDKFQATGVFVNQIEQQGFSIYPNPANTFITIHGLTHPSYAVYNTLGAIVLEGNGNQIQVGQLPDGLYFLVLEEGGKRYTRQVEVVH